MGTWGTAIFSDDVAANVRGDFRETEFEVRDVVAYRLPSGRSALLRVAEIRQDKGGRILILRHGLF